MIIPFKTDDGGRKAAGFIFGAKGDCVCRAVAIASGLSYTAVWNRLALGNMCQRKRRADCRRFKDGRAAGKATADHGITCNRKWFRTWLKSLGFEWVSCMGIGTGCKVHLRPDELPPGRLIVRVSKHLCAVIDGTIHDIYDPSRDGTRCVYGYWQQKK